MESINSNKRTFNIFLIVTSFVFLVVNSFGQDMTSCLNKLNYNPRLKNSLCIEAGGVGFLYSLNYERSFSKSNFQIFNARIGFTAIPTHIEEGEKNFEWDYSVPVSFTRNVNIYDPFWLEYGLGFCFYPPNVISGIHGDLFPIIGIKVHDSNASFFSKFLYTPIIERSSGEFSYNNWLGVSIGFHF